jgi:hypothetical protein
MYLLRADSDALRFVESAVNRGASEGIGGRRTISSAREFRLHRSASTMWCHCCTGQTDAEIEKVFRFGIGHKTPSATVTIRHTSFRFRAQNSGEPSVAPEPIALYFVNFPHNFFQVLPNLSSGMGGTLPVHDDV